MDSDTTNNSWNLTPEQARDILARTWARTTTYSFRINPSDRKVRLALDQVSEQLPLRLSRKISEIRFGPDGAPSPQFEVVFAGGKIVTFGNVDTFPTGADIARIAVECP